MDFDIDRRQLLKATGAGIATATVTAGTAGAVTNLGDLPGEGTEESPYEIAGFEDFLAIDQDLTAHYVLTDDIEFGAESSISPLAFDASGYGSSDPFLGTLDGQGNEVRNFVINSSVTYSGAGIFGSIGDGGVVKNLDVVNVSVTGDDLSGGLVGILDGGEGGEISNVSVGGTVDCYNRSGGLVGEIRSGTVTDSASSATVAGSYTVGGVVGSVTGGEVVRTYAEGNVGPSGESSGSEVGGFAGRINGGSVTLCFATGNVAGGYDVGGFVGDFSDGTVTKAYARGDVQGTGVESGPLGGFVGSMDTSYGTPMVEEVYSSGAVTGGYGGGLIGLFSEGELVLRERITALSSHATDSYWDVPASGLETSDGGVGLGEIGDTPPAGEMTGNDAPDNMSGFDFEETWVAVTGDVNVAVPDTDGSENDETVLAQEGDGYPVLGWQVEEGSCVSRRGLGRGQSDEGCPDDRSIGRGETRREIDRETGRNSDTARRGRGRSRSGRNGGRGR